MVSLAKTQKNMKEILKKVFNLDTKTHYLVDGSMTIEPEEWHSGEKLCKYPHKYRALVYLNTNGMVKVTRMDQLPTDNHRYEQLFCEHGKGYECVVRRTQEKIVIRIAVTKFLTWREITRMVHQAYLIVAGFLKKAKEE